MMDPASMDAAELRTGLVLVGASIVMTLVAPAERTVSVGIAVASVYLARDVSITVRATFDPHAMAAVPDARQVILAAMVLDLRVKTILDLTAVLVAECLSSQLDLVATVLRARSVGSATMVWFRWVLTALDGAGMVLTKSHVGPPEPRTPWHATLKVHLAAVPLLCNVYTSVHAARMVGTEASLSIRPVLTTSYLTTRDMSLTEGRGAGAGLDTRDSHASMTRTTPGQFADGIFSRLWAALDTTFSMLVAVLDVCGRVFRVCTEVSVPDDMLMFCLTCVVFAKYRHDSDPVSARLVALLVRAVVYATQAPALVPWGALVSWGARPAC